MSHNDTRTALVVVSHHRSDSLTAHIARRTIAQLEDAGYTVDLLDLHAEGFDPRMNTEDQPDWNDRDKPYSPEVEDHMRRVLAAEVIIAVFPIYWAYIPALLKGWIDRVWNYGFAYGRSKPRLAGKRMLWLGLAGATADDAIIPAIQTMLDTQLSASIAYYCGLSDSRTVVLPDAEERPQRLDAAGNLEIGDAVTGTARDAHFAAFERTTAQHVTDFLTPVGVPS
ncbi:NAD(P)H oxidoreductase [Nocardia sp. NBC_01503]|uniref:NAD(P)H oxidoreductase n=1 Tax=Nocardia sp. NBC_01503 TaxID=2975997 RepID=UPI002E7C4576|nr:NAD(P)H oxidoreductase [Nocardia sp. NBC_01503]WTL33235.1 NAD(P)H oxidoreductase [Nocardia sp. NBC_01503]